MTHISTSTKDTERIAGEIVSRLGGGSALKLAGDLGAGKTVFAKGVATALGIGEEVTSPTFGILRSYKGDKFVLHHIDAYRLNSANDAYDIGLDEVIGAADSITVIEWGNLIQDMLPPHTIAVAISRLDENTREIKVG